MKGILQRISGSLRARIVLVFLLAFLPVLIFVAVTVEFFLVPPIEQSIRDSLANSTRVLASAVRTSASVAIRNHLKAIAERNLEIARYHFSLIDQKILSKDEAIVRLREILLSQKVGTSGYIYCLDSYGNVLVHPNSEVEGRNVSSFSFVREQKRIKVGYLEYDWQNPGEPAPRPKALYMVYFEPLDWIISASSYRSEFNELLDPEDFRETVLSPRFGKTGYAYVFDKDGQVLIHPKYNNFNVLKQDEMSSSFAKEMLARGTGSLDYEWRNPDEKGLRKKIAVYEIIQEYGWLIVSSAYKEEVLRPVLVARLMAHGSMVLLLFCAGLTSYYLSGRITRPVDEMITQLDRNARSGVTGPLPVLTGDELGRLACEFNVFLAVVQRQNEDIREQQLRYRSLFEASLDAVLLVQGITIVDCNPAALKMFRARDETIIGRTVVDLSPSEQPGGERSFELAGNIMQNYPLSLVQTFEWLHCTLDGKIFDAEVRLKTFGEQEGTPLLIAYVRDITERKQADDALKESELKYRQLIDNATDAIFIIQDEKIVFANNKTIEISGYHRDELAKVSLGNLVHPDDFGLIVERHRRRVKGEDVLSTYTFRFMKKDNAELTAQLSTVLIDWNGKPATLNFVRDVTELKKMEAAFQEAQKMEAIGTLAGGIAHDFNNILMGIQGRVSLLDAIKSSRETREHIRVIENHVKSATGLTRQLLGFARGGKYDPKPIDVGVLLRSSAEMFGRTKKEIEIRIETPEHPVVVEVDKSQLEQVLLNLYVNGWQAMPEGGEIRLQVRSEELTPAFCELHGVEVGQYGVISVTDSGIGMDESVQKQIFDPFFTTKDKERGTGLGLASVYGIIQNHNGIITIESKVGVGSTFCIYLPLSAKIPQKEIGSENEIVDGKETILLVDDEDMILDVGKAMLETLGYRIIRAKGGLEAVDLIQSGQEKINLILLDLIMPDLDGGKTLDQIRLHDQSVPVILSSGYSVDEQAAELLQKGKCSDFIQKPFSLSELSNKIRNIFDS